MKTPTLLIVTDYRELSAYLVGLDGLTEVVKRVDFQCDGQTSVPLIAWNDERDGDPQLAATIEGLLRRYRPPRWAIASPQRLCRNLTALLPQECKETLVAELHMPVSRITVTNVVSVFEQGLRRKGAGVSSEEFAEKPG
ncbi:hypothetical protein HQ447_05755 [bacterium]|nr:hypothetical protein [bacterium]